MNDPRVNYNPPDGWVRDLKPGDLVWDLYWKWGVFEVEAVDIMQNDYCRVHFTNVGAYGVDCNGYLKSSVRQDKCRDLLPLFKRTIPEDAGDGE